MERPMANDTQNLYQRKWITNVSLGILDLSFLGLGLSAISALAFVCLGWLVFCRCLWFGFLSIPISTLALPPFIGGWLHAPRMRQEAEDGGLNSSWTKSICTYGKST